MKHTLTFLLALAATSITASAQSATQPLESFKGTNYGNATAELIYQYDGIDPVSKKYKDLEYMLQVGPQVTLFKPYGSYRSDSIMVAWEGKGKTSDDYHRFYQKNPDSRGESVLRTLGSNPALKVRDKVFITNYTYTEPQPQMKWKLSKETRTIGGRKCRKATLRYAGRDWTAWYDPTLPLTAGPWKFYGLPGAIVKISDKTGSHSFELIRVRATRTPILEAQRHSRQATQQEIDRLKATYAVNPNDVMGNGPAAPRDMSGRLKKFPVRKRKDVYINPIHLN